MYPIPKENVAWLKILVFFAVGLLVLYCVVIIVNINGISAELIGNISFWTNHIPTIQKATDYLKDEQDRDRLIVVARTYAALWECFFFSLVILLPISLFFLCKVISSNWRFQYPPYISEAMKWRWILHMCLAAVMLLAAIYYVFNNGLYDVQFNFVDPFYLSNQVYKRDGDFFVFAIAASVVWLMLGWLVMNAATLIIASSGVINKN